MARVASQHCLTLGERAKWTDTKQIKAGPHDPLAEKLSDLVGEFAQ